MQRNRQKEVHVPGFDPLKLPRPHGWDQKSLWYCVSAWGKYTANLMEIQPVIWKEHSRQADGWNDS